jgi:hypothetical protein
MTAGFFGAAQDGIKRHDDGKVLHSTHGLRQYITPAAGLLWLAFRLRRLPRFPRRLDSGSFFGAAQDGIERHDDRKPLHSTAKIGTQRQNAAHNAAQVHSLRQFIDFSNPWLFWRALLFWLALREPRQVTHPNPNPKLSKSTIRGFIELLHFVHFEHLLETKLKTVHEAALRALRAQKGARSAVSQCMLSKALLEVSLSCCTSCTSSTSFETKLKKVHEVQYLSAGSATLAFSAAFSARHRGTSA